jgi:hypothetical protein
MLMCPAVTSAAAATPAHLRPTPVHAIAESLPTLRNAVALATLVAIDPKTHVAEFRINCGWYIKLVGKEQYLRPTRKVRIGHWRVELRGLYFQFETYPNGPVSGIAHQESLREWESSAEASGWSGTLNLFHTSGPIAPEGFIADGPTTDICAGVLG